MKTLKSSKRYLAFALTFLMPIYTNFELLAEQNKEKIEVSEHIKNKEDAKKEIDRIVKLTENAIKNKDYKLAIKSLKKIADIEKKFFGINHPDLADTYNEIAKTYLIDNNYNQAQIYFLQEISIREITNGKENKLLAKKYINLGQIYYTLDSLDKSEEAFNLSLKNLKKYNYEDNEIKSLKSEIFYWLGQCQTRRGLHVKAREFYFKALAIEKTMKENLSFIATLYNWIGDTNLKENQF